MGKFVDLKGMKFGVLVVVKYVGESKWICQCECGNEKIIRGGNLTNGTTKSCGCLHRKKISEKNLKDLKGKTYGRWTVIEKTDKKTKSGNVYWVCKCECGTIKSIVGSSLTSGQTTSCGCLRNEKAKQQMEQLWENNNFKQMQSEKTRQQWKDEEFRKMKSDKTSERMKQQTGSKNPNYKGGITPISMYLRGLQIVRQWRKDTYIRENSKCQLTGKHVHGGNSDVHHLYGFNMIVKDGHDLHNIEIKPQVKDYTDEELKLLEDYVTSCHTDTTNAVLLSEDVHDLFHSLYGQGDNTPEQFEEFRQRYLNGELDSIQ